MALFSKLITMPMKGCLVVDLVQRIKEDYGLKVGTNLGLLS